MRISWKTDNADGALASCSLLAKREETGAAVQQCPKRLSIIELFHHLSSYFTVFHLNASLWYLKGEYLYQHHNHIIKRDPMDSSGIPISSRTFATRSSRVIRLSSSFRKAARATAPPASSCRSTRSVLRWACHIRNSEPRAASVCWNEDGSFRSIFSGRHTHVYTLFIYMHVYIYNIHIIYIISIYIYPYIYIRYISYSSS